MPTLLITGITSYLAPHICEPFLRAGWDIVGVVRSKAKGEAVLKSVGLRDGVKEGKVRFEVVPELATLGEKQWVGILGSVDAICLAHSPSPMDFSAKSYDHFRSPSVDAVKVILTAASKSDRIKAVTLVASSSGVLNILAGPDEHAGKIYTAEDYIPWTEEDAIDPAKNFHSGHWYSISKKYGELAAFRVKEETGSSWSLATFPAERILGPVTHLSSLADLKNAQDPSTAPLAQALLGGKDGQLPFDFNPLYVDPRDVAHAVFSATSSHANGRFLLTSGKVSYQHFVDYARKARPDLGEWIVKGKEGEGVLKDVYVFDAGQSERVLGVKYHTLEETARDTVASFEKLGAYAV
ncbi:hypothetical protein B9479_003445 [Cryptococcus floricola]|uniref:NAD-dependent epimerase/dehydratase domain-containing protein n=1 Tax=Cryptococcus floricola TaxID=2591691 RepID=A0A5D3B0C2_9TREE|nr:hypothetical protein B9479_003445 [Cryptococcus floricola]